MKFRSIEILNARNDAFDCSQKYDGICVMLQYTCRFDIIAIMVKYLFIPQSSRIVIFTYPLYFFMSGSKSSSSTTKIAKWIDTPPCSCPREAYEVYKIRIKSVPMAGEFWIAIANIITLGYAKNWYNSQQYSHDVLELSIECTLCKCTFE